MDAPHTSKHPELQSGQRPVCIMCQRPMKIATTPVLLEKDERPQVGLRYRAIFFNGLCHPVAAYSRGPEPYTRGSKFNQENKEGLYRWHVWEGYFEVFGHHFCSPRCATKYGIAKAIEQFGTDLGG